MEAINLNREKKNLFSALFAATGELYNKPITKGLIQLYWMSLSGYDYQDIKKSLTTHISNPKSGKFFPKPCDIIENITGTDDHKSMRAWDIVYFSIKKHGYVNNYNFECNIIHNAIERLGGIYNISTRINNGCPFLENNFLRIYKQYLSFEPWNKIPYLKGKEYWGNCNNLKLISPTIMLGDNSGKQIASVTALSTIC